MDAELERLDSGGAGVILHRDPDRPRTLRGEFVKAQGGEQADHGFRFAQRDQREVFVGFQRGIRDPVNSAPHLDQLPLTDQFPNARALLRGGTHPEECVRLRCSRTF